MLIPVSFQISYKTYNGTFRYDTGASGCTVLTQTTTQSISPEIHFGQGENQALLFPLTLPSCTAKAQHVTIKFSHNNFLTTSSCIFSKTFFKLSTVASS